MHGCKYRLCLTRAGVDPALLPAPATRSMYHNQDFASRQRHTQPTALLLTCSQVDRGAVLGSRNSQPGMPPAAAAIDRAHGHRPPGLLHIHRLRRTPHCPGDMGHHLGLKPEGAACTSDRQLHC